METGYETIIDTQNLIWTLVVYLMHGALVLVQTSLACFLLATGAHNLVLPDLDRPWLRRLGAAGIATPHTRAFGGIRVLLGLGLLAPLMLGVHWSNLANVRTTLSTRPLAEFYHASGRSTLRSVIAILF